MNHSFIYNMGGVNLTPDLIEDLEEAREKFFKDLDRIQEKYGKSNNLQTIRVCDSYHAGLCFNLNFLKFGHRYTYDASSHNEKSNRKSL